MAFSSCEKVTVNLSLLYHLQKQSTQHRAPQKKRCHGFKQSGCEVQLKKKLIYTAVISKIPLSRDNTDALAIVTQNGFNVRTKHIDVRYHRVREFLARNEISSHYISTMNQPADMLGHYFPERRLSIAATYRL